MSETKKRAAENVEEGASEAKKACLVEADLKEVQTQNGLKKFLRTAFADGETGYVECPAVYEGERALVFLAGGISGCLPWQDTMKDLIAEKCPGLVPINPRRANFDVSRTDIHHEQIKWEFDFLRRAAVIIFWFPKETLCPITLFELGTWSVLSKTHGSHILVGCDPDYARRADVQTQLSLLNDCEYHVDNSLESLADSLQKWWNEHSE